MSFPLKLGGAPNLVILGLVHLPILIAELYIFLTSVIWLCLQEKETLLKWAEGEAFKSNKNVFTLLE